MDFIVKGSFKAGERPEHFTKTVASPNKKQASEKTFSLIGSEHGVNRRLMKIDSVEEVKK
ncbi:MAG: 50S ribosomal protein L18a [Candidatus Methanoperedens sp.]|nr:50S ribosomal protein L18a [Candidatus Methanoperedens sp.]